MKRVYLLAYSDTLGTRQEVKAILDKLPEVITWRYDLPHSFYLVSESDAKSLAVSIRAETGEKGRFLVTEIPDANRWGWLPPDTWYFVRNRKVKPK